MNIQRQQGLSFIGFVTVIALLMFVVFLGLRIMPVYMEYYTVVNILKDVAAEEGAVRHTHYELRMAVIKRLDLNYSDNVKESDIKIRTGNGVYLGIKYEVRRPLVGNLDMVAHFDKSVRLSD